MEPSIDLAAAEDLMRHGRFVRALARSLLADEHAAEDVAQEAWLRYFQRPPRSALDPRGWFARVVRNLASNARRDRDGRSEREQNLGGADPSEARADPVVQAEILRSVVDAVLALDEPYRDVVLARYFRDWEPSRIARETGAPIATVKSRLQRALSLLREKLDRTHGGRASWGLALAPFAGLGRQATLVSALKLAAASAVVAVPAYFLWVARTNRPAVPSPGATANLQTRSALDASTADPIENSRQVASPPVQVATSNASPNHLSGTVRNLPYPELGLPGGPAAGLKIFVPIRVEGSNPPRYERATTVTRDDGSFDLEMPKPDPGDLIWLSSDADDVWRAISHEIELEKGAPAREGLQLTRAAHGILHGVVVGGNGGPIPGAGIRLRPAYVQPALETEIVSDDHGAFALPWRNAGAVARAVDPSWTVMAVDPFVQLETGGWAPARIVVASSATLRVRAVGAHGSGLAGLRVAADLAAEERGAIGIERSMQMSGTTDARGEIELGGVWAGHHLQLFVGEHRVTGHRSGELTFEEEPGSGEPIVLAPGEVRSFVVRWNGDLRIAGTTVSADGRSMGRVGVEITDLGSGGADGQQLGVLDSDRDGRFETRLRSRTLRGPVRFVAREPGKKGLAARMSELGYAGESPPTDGAIGVRTMALSEVVDGVLHAEIVLEPGITITGSLFDARGIQVTRTGIGTSRLWAVESGRSLAETQRSVWKPGFGMNQEGVFTFFGLRKCDYDIYATEEIESNFTWPCFIHRFPGIGAGSQGIELRLPPRKEVHVRLRTHGEGVERIRVLLGALVPNDPELRKVAADRSSRITEAFGWPVGADLNFSGAGGTRMEEGNLDCAYYSTDDVAEHEVPPLGAGWYVFGILPVGAKGGLWSAQSTELRWYEPGDYTIDFDAVPSATISGRILADATREHLGVAVETPSGRRIPLEVQPGFGQSAFVLETDAGGRFVIRHAPVGSFKLLAGNAAELAHGRFRTAVILEVGANGISGLEIRF